MNKEYFEWLYENEEEHIIYYSDINRGGFRNFRYNDITMRYMDYTFKESLELFKQKCYLTNKKVKLVKDNFYGTYGFMYP